MSFNAILAKICCCSCASEKDYNMTVPPVSPLQPTQLTDQGSIPNRLEEEFRQLAYPKPNSRAHMHRISLYDIHYIASEKSATWDRPKFWKFVFNERPGLLVKLNQEGSEYLPKEAGDSINSLDPAIPNVICVKKEKIQDELIKRVIEVAMQSDIFQVTHLEFTGWPDFGVPNLDSFECLLQTVNQECPVTAADKRIFVHCGGGIGRTGTFIAAHASEHLSSEHRSENPYPDLINKMREQRPERMVETYEQYAMLVQRWQKEMLPNE